MQETAEILSDPATLADLKQSREDTDTGNTFGMEHVRAELEQRHRQPS